MSTKGETSVLRHQGGPAVSELDVLGKRGGLVTEAATTEHHRLGGLQRRNFSPFRRLGV